MTLHRVTVAAFAALLVLSGIGSLVARQGPAPAVDPVELSDDAAETPPAQGGQVEESAPLVTDSDDAAPEDAAPAQILLPDDPIAQEAPVDTAGDAALVERDEGDDDAGGDDADD